MGSFSNQNILVVGASSGIGHELAKQLLEAGANVYSASRNQPAGLLVAKHFPLDVLDFNPESLADLPTELHAVVYCPGSITLKPFNRLSEKDFLRDYQINVIGAVKVIQASLSALRKAKGASVVLFSTVASDVGMNFHASIAAAKGAVEGLAKSLAAEYAGANIRFNVIAPSLTDTPLAKGLLSSEDKRNASAKRHPLHRVGTPEDMANVARFLISSESSWMTGQVIGVDGGMSNLRPL